MLDKPPQQSRSKETLDRIVDARYALLPLGLTFAQILPPPNEYVNIHRNCFHLWEIEGDEW